MSCLMINCCRHRIEPQFASFDELRDATPFVVVCTDRRRRFSSAVRRVHAGGVEMTIRQHCVVAAAAASNVALSTCVVYYWRYGPARLLSSLVQHIIPSPVSQSTPRQVVLSRPRANVAKESIVCMRLSCQPTAAPLIRVRFGRSRVASSRQPMSVETTHNRIVLRA